MYETMSDISSLSDSSQPGPESDYNMKTSEMMLKELASRQKMKSSESVEDYATSVSASNDQAETPDDPADLEEYLDIGQENGSQQSINGESIDGVGGDVESISSFGSTPTNNNRPISFHPVDMSRGSYDASDGVDTMGSMSPMIPIARERNPATTSETVDHQEARKKKFQMLMKIKELNKDHDITLPMTVSMKSSLVDIAMVYDTMVDTYRKKYAVEGYRKMLVMSTTLVEFMNNKYDPFDFHLKGWSENIYEQINKKEYDAVFQELHEKYKSDKQMPPEVRLMMLVGGSAFMHHTFHKASEKMGSMFGASGTPASTPPASGGGSKMNGPSTNLDDLLKTFRKAT